MCIRDRMAACQTPSILVYAREWAFRYISQLFTDPALTSAYVPGTTGDKYFSYSGVNNDDLNVVWGNENANSENGGAPNPTSSSSSTSTYSRTGQPFVRKWTAQFSNTGKKLMQTAQPCIGNSSLNTATNFRSLSDAQRLPCSTPAGGVQYGKMNIYNMSNLGNNEFVVNFSETTSSGQTLINFLTGVSAVQNVSYSVTSSTDSLVVFEKPIFLLLNNSAPIFVVIIRMTFLKSDFLPLLSVKTPASITCKRILNISGCAFSISSRSKTQ